MLKIIKINRVVFIPVKSIDFSVSVYLGRKKYFKRYPKYIKKVFVLDGQWDIGIPIGDITSKEYFDVQIGYRSIYQIFNQDISFKNSDQYKKMYEDLLVFGKTRRNEGYLFNNQEIDSYFLDLNSIYIDIKMRGYLSQVDLDGNSLDEIGVIIDRNGDIKKIGRGMHRLAMAEILNVKTVPVFIHQVHYSWVIDCCTKYGLSINKSIQKGFLDLQYE